MQLFDLNAWKKRQRRLGDNAPTLEFCSLQVVELGNLCLGVSSFLGLPFSVEPIME